MCALNAIYQLQIGERIIAFVQSPAFENVLVHQATNGNCEAESNGQVICAFPVFGPAPLPTDPLELLVLLLQLGAQFRVAHLALIVTILVALELTGAIILTLNQLIGMPSPFAFEAA